MRRILLVDDHVIVRRGLRQVLEESGPSVETEEAHDWASAIKKLEESNFDAVVLDISLPGRSGLDLLREIKSREPALPVLVLSMHPEEQYAVRAFSTGASGYMTKDCAPDELVKAVDKVIAGGKYVSSSFAETLASRLVSDNRDNPHEALSDREHEIMLMIAAGKTMKEAAAELHLSPKTVSTYRSRILQKMDMSSNAQLVEYVVRNDLG